MVVYELTHILVRNPHGPWIELSHIRREIGTGKYTFTHYAMGRPTEIQIEKWQVRHNNNNF